MSRTLMLRLGQEGIRDERVLWAMGQVPRHLFLPPALRDRAEEDRPFPIGHGQTISAPYVVAFMSAQLGLLGREKVLEVGTGSGYQTAVLSLLCREVWSVEIVPELSARAAEVLLGALGLGNVHLKVADGWRGWPEEAPFDRIVVTAAPREVPPELQAQLKGGGRMVLPVGGAEEAQVLKVVDKGEDGAVSVKDVLPVRFVPLTRGEPRLA